MIENLKRTMTRACPCGNAEDRKDEDGEEATIFRRLDGDKPKDWEMNEISR
jgi:hypothetical protein